MVRFKYSFNVMFIFPIFISLGCIYLQRGIGSNLYFSNENFAVYELNKSPVEFSNINYTNTIQVDEKLLKSILLNIRKENSIVIFNEKEMLWDFDTIDNLVPILKKILKPTNKEKTFFLIVKAEDKFSPYTRIFRTSLYINRDGNVLQMIFGEVNANINFGTQFSFQDWSNPSFFLIKCEKKKTLFFEGNLEGAFQYKKDSNCEDKNTLPTKSLDSKLESLTNYKWIQIDLDKAIALSKKTNTPDEKGNSETRENRLKELMNLYKKGLINKEDYEIKKAEILGEL